MAQASGRLTGRAGWGTLLLVAAGAVWVLIELLRAGQDALPGVGQDTTAALGLLPRLLALPGLVAVHRTHQGRAGALGATGLGFVLVGLVLDVLGRVFAFVVHGGTSEDPAPGVVLGGVLGLLGLALQVIGFLLYGIGTLRARALPLWGSAMPLAIAVLSVLVNVLSRMEELVPVSVLGGLLRAAAWAALGLGAYTVAQAQPDESGEPAMRESVWRPFVSLGTVISGLLAVAVWSLEWAPAVGLLVVLLLYVHEVGHVTAALLRGVRVEQAPFFLPGFGAFVQTGRTSSPWDDAWISLGGPAIGGAVALLAKVIGQVEGIPALAHAGDFALILNVLNLAPFSPLDGGHIAGLTGWFGFALTLLLGVFLLAQLPGLFLSLLAIIAIVRAFRSARDPTPIRWRTRTGIAAVYFALILVEVAAHFISGPVEWLPSNRPPGWPGAGDLFQVAFLVFLAGTFLLPYAWRDEQTARVRYGISALLGWPQYLLGRPWMIPITVSLAAHTVGLPGLAWLEGLIVRWGADRNRSAAVAAAHGFDCLSREGRDDSPAAAGAWLDRMTPALERGGPEVLGLTYLSLVEMGYARSAGEWVTRQNAGRAEPLPLLAPAALAYAWQCVTQRRERHALPYARMAAADDPEDPAAQDVLGQALLAGGDVPEAEECLRRALERRERPGTRVALARALAAQDRFAEAAAEAQRALDLGTEGWPEDEPGVPEVTCWLQEWRIAAERQAQAAPSDRPVPSGD